MKTELIMYPWVHVNLTPEILKISLTDSGRIVLWDVQDNAPEKWGTDDVMYDFFEYLVCNSELEWINPEETGDLTDAPILGILGEPQPDNSGPHGVRYVGHWDGKDLYQPILQRWGYMSYQVRYILDELLECGEVKLVASS